MKNNKLIGKIIDLSLNILIVLLAIFLLVSMYTAFQVKILKNEYSNFFGYSLFEVQTGSMHGSIEAGDWIIVKLSKDIKVGDVVTYKHNKEYITHRVMEIYKGTYVTKGDANNTKDEPIDQSQIVGKVTKTLHGFGILRKTIFNPAVIIALIITLYLFNLTFKTGKTEFDELIEKIIKHIKQKIKNKNSKKTQPIKTEKVKVMIENPNETIKTTMPEKIENPSNIITVINDNIEKQPEQIEEKQEEKIEKQTEEELSKTAMFRMVSIKSDEKYYKEKEIPEKEEIVDVDDLSKTSVFRIIQADARDVDLKENKIIEEQPEKYTEVVNLKLNAEEIEQPKQEKQITKEYIIERIKNKKCKNIIEKTFYTKKIIYEEIIEVLLKKEKVYIQKSKMKNEFIEQYMNTKYFGLDEERENIKTIMNEYWNDLTKKNIRDEKKINTINAYKNAIEIITELEKEKELKIEEKLNKKYTYDEETINKMSEDIKNIINYSNEYIQEILNKLDTNTFEVKYNKIIGEKNLYGTYLNHNISFSKVYSDYIVDKTYNEGIISEDKIEVLFNLLMCKITKDLLDMDYKSKYIIYIPQALYGKDKKLDKLLSTIDNEYTKNHIYILTSITNMLKNKEDIKRIRKNGYLFGLNFNKQVEIKDDDMGYVYLADYYFIDSYLDVEKICEKIPGEIIKKLIKDNINKKVGNNGGE